MPDSTGSQNRSLGQRMKRGVQTKILIPAAASIVSVAVSYLIKKLPTILEEKVLPKLQETGATDGKTEATKQFAHARAEDAAAVADIDDDDQGDSDGETSQEQPQPTSADLSAEDREEERSRREQRRQERKRSTQKAA
jgi:hypothetical protein